MLELNADLLPEGVFPGSASVKYRPAGGFDDVLDDLHGGCLTGAVGAEQTETTTMFDRKRYISDRDERTEPFFQIDNLKNRHGPTIYPKTGFDERFQDYLIFYFQRGKRPGLNEIDMKMIIS